MFKKIIEEVLNKYFDTRSDHDGYKWEHEIICKLFGEDITHKYYDSPTKASEMEERLKSEIAKAISDKIFQFISLVKWRGKSFKQYEEENKELRESIKILNFIKAKE